MRSYLILICALLSWSVGAQELQKSYGGVRNVVINTLQGKMQLLATKANEVEVKINKQNFSERCTLDMQQVGDTLTIEVSKGWLFTMSVQCETDLSLALPARVNVRAFQATGDIEAVALTNPLTIKSPTAKITLSDVTSKEVNIEATSGSVILNNAQNAAGNIRVHTVSGSVRYQSSNSTNVTFSSISGSLAAEGKPVDPAAPSQIQFSSVSGSFVWL